MRLYGSKMLSTRAGKFSISSESNGLVTQLELKWVKMGFSGASLDLLLLLWKARIPFEGMRCDVWNEMKRGESYKLETSHEVLEGCLEAMAYKEEKGGVLFSSSLQEGNGGACKLLGWLLGCLHEARNWFDDMDPKSVENFEELSHKFLEEFSQQKRYAKDPTEIHGINKRPNEGLQSFIDQFKSKSSHIKVVSLMLHISAFMHDDNNLELAKNHNNRIPQIMNEMFEQVRVFIRGEVTAGSLR
ncbi:reverse transcriptase domain-containing protein [Tanacetum coccineum]|uniref:Reverse transcriptase domain-containing protein n=1 Tax=Tanacetum coccineum TaxID=301880 RepID=A0ABQ5H7M4_9ASTR